LVVAFAIAGRANIDMTTEPLGNGHDGKPVYLRDIWPTNAEIEALLSIALNPVVFRERYSDFT
jgi:aconitate hydratase